MEDNFGQTDFQMAFTIRNIVMMFTRLVAKQTKWIDLCSGTKNRHVDALVSENIQRHEISLAD